MTGLIIYRSTYGSTKQYAEWIRDETGFPLFESTDKSIPWNAETIVIGSPLMAFKPSLVGWMQKHWDKLTGKRVFLFTTSGADPAKQPVRELVERALPGTMKQAVQVFPLAGRFDFNKLNGGHRLMIRLAASFNAAVRHQMHHPVDGVARENLRDLVAAIKNPSRRSG